MPLTSDESQRLTLDLSDSQTASRIARALSVPKRLEILRLMGEKNVMSVNEIAQTLNMPVSSASMHITVLEEAGFIACERMPSIHGTMKMCTRKCDSVLFHLRVDPPHSTHQFVQSLPIGAYSQAESITNPSGLASRFGPIGVYGQESSFYLPERLEAQILWMKSGCLCYRFASLPDASIEPEYLELSFEVCSEAQATVWRSVIQITINGCLLGSGECSCENEGRRGTFNPAWWPDVATQHGELQKWRVTRDGTYLQGVKISNVRIRDLKLASSPRINILFHVPSDGDGINLFGTDFGDYNQAIQLVIGYQA